MGEGTAVVAMSPDSQFLATISASKLQVQSLSWREGGREGRGEGRGGEEGGGGRREGRGVEGRRGEGMGAV